MVGRILRELEALALVLGSNQDDRNLIRALTNSDRERGGLAIGQCPIDLLGI